MYLFAAIAGYFITTFLCSVLCVRIFPHSITSRTIDKLVLLFPLFPVFVFLDLLALAVWALGIMKHWLIDAFDILTARPRRRADRREYDYYYRYRRRSDKRRSRH